ncbi:hypothetical protein [Mycobacterium sp. 852002-10029_SCH5224772]|uniref:hypothetical protein n=1 Tax=Mycobacterium sp. 852002-10029_SCH5224772 TaxID=1834083 RepID=UPI0012E771D8|nr:hypothetical protein [Mycobacterium sp. 852002-10029_SCH5224772]
MKIILNFSPVARRYRRRSRRRLSKATGPDLAEMSIWPANSDKPPVNHHPLAGRERADHSPLYPYTVDRTKPIRVLEIGSFYADSLPIWQQRLHPDSVIAVVDINSKLVRIGGPEGTHVRFGSEQNSTLLTAVAAQYGPFDVILDTGSTTSADMIKCLDCLFPSGLVDRGIYVVKGSCCDIWTFYSQLSFVDLIKALVDAIYGHYTMATCEGDFQADQIIIMRRAIGV